MSNASRSVAWERIIIPATLLLLSLLLAGPLWGAGLLNTRGGGDSPFLLLRTHQLAANLRAGVFPVRWMPDAAYGFGYPFFSYYAALPYYVAAAFELLGLDILTAIKLTQTLFLAASALTMYRWAEQALANRPGAWLAAVAYVAAPFHLVNLYVRGDSLSEFAAFAFYPLVLWGLDRLAAQPSLRRTLLPSLAYAGLIVTHNVSALIFSPFVLLYVALQITRMAIIRPDYPRGQAVGRYSLLTLPVLIALLLAAWFWLPALAETQDVQLSAQTSGYFFYGNHFRGADLVQRGLLFDYAAGQDAGSPFAMGMVQAGLALMGVTVVSLGWIRSQRAHRVGTSVTSTPRPRREDVDMLTLGFGLVGLLVSTWLITPLSRPLWDHLPLLPMVQFPWRFLSVQALFTALLTGAAVRVIGAQRQRAVWAAALILGSLLMMATLISLEPNYLPITADEVTSERLQLYELFTGNIGSTIRYEYLPRWVIPRPFTGPEQLDPDAPPKAIPMSGTMLSAERLDRQPTHRVWQLETGSEGATVAFPLYYWPGWQGFVDGKRVSVEPAVGSGYLSLTIPPGSHSVELRLGRTRLRLAAEAASLITMLAAFAVYVRAWIEERGEGRKAANGQRGRQTEGETPASGIRDLQAVISCLPFVTVLSLVVVFQPRVAPTGSRDLTMDFEEMPYLHHNPDGVPFDGGSTAWLLTSYSYESPQSSSAQRIIPGQSLRVTINWRMISDQTQDVAPKQPSALRLVSPAAIRHDEVAPLAEAFLRLDEREVAHDRETSTAVTLTLPREAAPGIHLLQIGDAHPLCLRPIWIIDPEESVEAPVDATFADDALLLHGVQAEQTAHDQLRVQLDWSALRPVSANYGLSLSLTDTAGNEWLRQDERPGYNTQPGYGFLPTSLWPLNRTIEDRHAPALVSGAPPGDRYTLTIDLYRVATWESVGQHALTTALTQTASPPSPDMLAQFGDALLLSRLDTPRRVRQGEKLEATAYWSTVKQPSMDYRIAWQLERPGQSIAHTQPLAAGSSPQAWPAGAWIASRMAMLIPPTSPPGDYSLSLSLIETVSGAEVGSYRHPTPVTVLGRERVWELPDMERTVGTRFGGMIELAGYDLRQGRESVHLTLYWRALTTPDRHYTFFVHLADPETGEPASQVDTMPREFRYPTGQWAPGEVVVDEVELPTRGVAGGRYDLAVGWYDPDTRVRLEAVNSEGARLPDDRLLLPSSITVP